MSSKVQKACKQKKRKLPGLLMEEKVVENKKENIWSNSKLKGEKCIRQSFKDLLENTKPEENNLSLSLKSRVKVKTSGYWCKKLQNLEGSTSEYKKNFKLYDFNETNESDSWCERKQKTKKKVGLKKKKEPIQHKKLINKPVENYNSASGKERKMTEFHSHSRYREKIILSKERKKLAEKGEKFTFSTGMPSLGVTSTPKVNNDNLIAASNFLFLSPIIKKEEATSCGSVNQILSLEQKVIDSSFSVNQETPMVEMRLKRISYRRVLRSGKVIKS